MTPEAERLAAAQARIAAAARRAGRPAEAVTLVGACKRVPAARAAAAVVAGLRHLGENYVQEAAAKIPAVEARLAGAPRPCWHLLGRLQRNKARHAARLFDVVETLDGAPLAAELERRAAAAGRRLEVLVQVDLAGEPRKAGLPPAELRELLARCAELPHLQVVGLMTLPPAAADPEASRPYFARLRALRDELAGAPGGAALRHLSMGMSGDFEVAVEEGATIVRLGTALFGSREE